MEAVSPALSRSSDVALSQCTCAKSTYATTNLEVGYSKKCDSSGNTRRIERELRDEVPWHTLYCEHNCAGGLEPDSRKTASMVRICPGYCFVSQVLHSHASFRDSSLSVAIARSNCLLPGESNRHLFSLSHRSFKCYFLTMA